MTLGTRVPSFKKGMSARIAGNHAAFTRLYGLIGTLPVLESTLNISRPRGNSEAQYHEAAELAEAIAPSCA